MVYSKSAFALLFIFSTIFFAGCDMDMDFGDWGSFTPVKPAPPAPPDTSFEAGWAGRWYAVDTSFGGIDTLDLSANGDTLWVPKRAPFQTMWTTTNMTITATTLEVTDLYLDFRCLTYNLDGSISHAWSESFSFEYPEDSLMTGGEEMDTLTFNGRYNVRGALFGQPITFTRRPQ